MVDVFAFSSYSSCSLFVHMLFPLIAIVTFPSTSTAHPLPTASSQLLSIRADASSSNAAPSWVAAPQQRGTWQLIIGCLTTLSLCAWTAYHPNVRPQKRTTSTLWRRFLWMMAAVVGPEAVLYYAWEQRWMAGRLRGELQELGARAVDGLERVVEVSGLFALLCIWVLGRWGSVCDGCVTFKSSKGRVGDVCQLTSLESSTTLFGSVEKTFYSLSSLVVSLLLFSLTILLPFSVLLLSARLIGRRIHFDQMLQRTYIFQSILYAPRRQLLGSLYSFRLCHYRTAAVVGRSKRKMDKSIHEIQF